MSCKVNPVYNFVAPSQQSQAKCNGSPYMVTKNPRSLEEEDALSLTY